MGAIWPEYESEMGNYLAIHNGMSADSMRSNFCADSYNFWYKLLPDVITSTNRDGHHEKSYFGRSRDHDGCDQTDKCPP